MVKSSLAVAWVSSKAAIQLSPVPVRIITRVSGSRLMS